jgi:hypothetical protein
MVPQTEESFDVTVTKFQSNTPTLPSTQPRDILHVPKLRLA